MKDRLTNLSYLRIFCEILLCIGIIIAFLYFGLHSDPFHTILTKIAPISVYLFFLSILVASIVAYSSWSGNQFLERIRLLSPYLSQRHKILILLTISICLSFIPVFTVWSNVTYLLNNIGGTLPLFDAGWYYQGAEEILHTGMLDSVNQRRPLNTLFLASQLLITNLSFRYALLLQSAVFGVSAFFASCALARTHGKSAGFVMFAALFGLSGIFLPEVLTESLGIIFGCVAFALLWSGIHEKNQFQFLSGLFFLTIALMTRAGPMLILPFSILFAGYLFMQHRKFNRGILLVAAFVVLLGVLFNQSLIWLFGDSPGLPVGNFAFILYGLAAGGKGWTQYQIDFPNLTGSEAQISSFVYEQSFNLILQNPARFAATIVNRLIIEPMNFFMDAFQSLFFGNFLEHAPDMTVLLLVSLIYGVIILGFLRFIFSCRKEPICYFLIGAIITTWVALPFFYGDAPFRSLAAIFPIIAAIFALGTVGWRHDPSQTPASGINPLIFAKVTSIIGIVILIAAFFAPFVGPGLLGFMLAGTPESDYNSHLATNLTGDQTFTMRVDKNLPYIEIIENTGSEHTFAPMVRKENFVIPEWIRQYYNFWEFPDDPSYPILLRGYDTTTNQTVLILAPRGFIPEKRQIVTFSATCTNCPDAEFPGPLRIYAVT